MPRAYDLYWTAMNGPVLSYLGPQVPFAWMKDQTPSKRVDQFQMFTEVLENTPDYYVLIITRDQYPGFFQKLEQYNWKRFLHHESKGFLWNPNYTPKTGYKEPRLKLVILKGTGKE